MGTVAAIQIARPQAGKWLHTGNMSPVGPCQLCPCLVGDTFDLGSWSGSQSWRVSSEDWQPRRGCRFSPALLAPSASARRSTHSCPRKRAAPRPENPLHGPSATPRALGISRGAGVFPLEQFSPTLSSAEPSGNGSQPLKVITQVPPPWCCHCHRPCHSEHSAAPRETGSTDTCGFRLRGPVSSRCIPPGKAEPGVTSGLSESGPEGLEQQPSPSCPALSPRACLRL